MAYMYMNTGSFSPASPTNYINGCRDKKYKNGNRTVYNRDCKYHKEDPAIIVKWMRRNFGERHQGWDFSLVGGCVTIELWDDRLITMYEMWQL